MGLWAWLVEKAKYKRVDVKRNCKSITRAWITKRKEETGEEWVMVDHLSDKKFKRYNRYRRRKRGKVQESHAIARLGGKHDPDGKYFDVVHNKYIDLSESEEARSFRIA